MKKYFAHLRPLERRLVVGVGVVLIIVLNWWFIWPEFSDLGNYERRGAGAEQKLKTMEHSEQHYFKRYVSRKYV